MKGAAMIPVGGRQIFAATKSDLALTIKGRRDDGHDAPASETIAPDPVLMQRDGSKHRQHPVSRGRQALSSRDADVRRAVVARCLASELS